MRQSWFGFRSLEAVSLAAAVFALLLTTSNAPAQSRGDPDRDDSNASAARDSDDDRNASGDQADRNDRSQDVRSTNGRTARGSRSARGAQARRGSHPALGVTFYNDDSNPLEIRRVTPGSPAEDAGLDRGDEIMSVNGRRVSSVQQLNQRLDRAGQNQEIELGILRDGRQETVLAMLSSNRGRAQRQGGYQAQAGRGYANRGYGNRGYGNREYGNREYGNREYGNRSYANREYDDREFVQGYGNQGRGYGNRREDDRDEGADRPFLGITLDEDSSDGVLVNDIYPESPAQQAGLRPGDEIIAIDDDDVQSSRDVMRILSQKDPDDDVTIEVDRNGRDRTLRATLTSQQQFLSWYNRNSYRTGRRNNYGRQTYDGGARDQGDADGDRSSGRRQRNEDQEDDD